MRGHRTQRGFTLLEVLIAMTLSVMLLGILTAGTRAVIDEWQDDTNPFEARIDRSLILLQLEQSLLGATPHGYTDPDSLEQYVFFEGTGDSLAWVSTVSPQATQALAAWQLLGAEQEGVTLKSTPAFADNPTERLDAASGAVLLPDFGLTFEYLTLDDLGRPEWLDEWSGTEWQSLPMAVRLTFAEDARDDDATTEMIVPLLHRQHETIEPVDVQ